MVGLDGVVAFEGTVRVDGKLSGEIFTEDVLIVVVNLDPHAMHESMIEMPLGELGIATRAGTR